MTKKATLDLAERFEKAKPCLDVDHYEVPVTVIGVPVSLEERDLIIAALRAGTEPIGYVSPITLKALQLRAEGHGFIVASAGYETIIPLYAAPPAEGAPAGWRLVPMKPTQEMIAAAEDARHAYVGCCYRDAFTEMVNAAPSCSSPAASALQPPAMAKMEERKVSAVADQIIGQIEDRFPNWKSYRDLVDCIDCTLHDLRSFAQPVPQPPLVWPASLPRRDEVRKLINDFISPDLDTQKAFASHRRGWIVSCLQTLLLLAERPAPTQPAPPAPADAFEGMILAAVLDDWCNGAYDSDTKRSAEKFSQDLAKRIATRLRSQPEKAPPKDSR